MFKFILALFTAQVLAIKKVPDEVSKLECCPDFDETFTLADKRTKAVAWPRKGYNCTREGYNCKKED